MALAAAQVVDALALRLTLVALSGGRVFTSRLWPLVEDELPCWRVTAETEDVELATIDDALNVHNLEVSAAGYVRATADIDDAMHALASQGLAALFAGTVPYGLQLTGIERDPVTDNEAAHAAIRLRLSTQFYVRPSAPETIVS
jgi:hypothetical protein